MTRHIILEIVLALLIKLKIMHIKHLTKIVGAPKKNRRLPTFNVTFVNVASL